MRFDLVRPCTDGNEAHLAHRSPGAQPSTLTPVREGCPTIEDAIALAAEAHTGQRYSSPEAEPYIFHPLRLMLRFQHQIDCMAAVLHDVVEDTNVTLAALVERGYPAELVSAVEALTRRENEAYETYIDRVAVHPVARRIKLADLAENLANNERDPKGPGNSERIARYRAAIDRLQD